MNKESPVESNYLIQLVPFDRFSKKPAEAPANSFMFHVASLVFVLQAYGALPDTNLFPRGTKFPAALLSWD